MQRVKSRGGANPLQEDPGPRIWKGATTNYSCGLGDGELQCKGFMFGKELQPFSQARIWLIPVLYLDATRYLERPRPGCSANLVPGGGAQPYHPSICLKITPKANRLPHQKPVPTKSPGFLHTKSTFLKFNIKTTSRANNIKFCI